MLDKEISGDSWPENLRSIFSTFAWESGFLIYFALPSSAPDDAHFFYLPVHLLPQGPIPSPRQPSFRRGDKSPPNPCTGGHQGLKDKALWHCGDRGSYGAVYCYKRREKLRSGKPQAYHTGVVFRLLRMGTDSVKSWNLMWTRKGNIDFEPGSQPGEVTLEMEVKAAQWIKSSRPGRPQSRTGDVLMSTHQLGMRMSMRTDRQGQILLLGPVMVTGTLAKKWLTSFQHEWVFIPEHGLSRACRRK